MVYLQLFTSTIFRCVHCNRIWHSQEQLTATPFMNNFMISQRDMLLEAKLLAR